MLIRVRSNVGIWRVETNADPNTSTGHSILQGIAASRPHVVYQKPLSLDPACIQHLDLNASLASQGLGQNGAMVHCRVDPASCADATVAVAGVVPMSTEGSAAAAATDHAWTNQTTNMKRVIGKDGSIQLIPTTEAAQEDGKGFRKGMMALRDIKMAWTLNEFVAMASQYEFKIKRQEEAVCKQVSLDTAAVSDFQAYLQRLQFARKRIAYLYGKFEETDDGKKTIVEAIYEPPQEPDPDAAEGFEQLDDPHEAKVEAVANMLGLKKVGWIVGGGKKKTRTDDGPEEEYVLTAAEIIMAAELQLEAAEGVEETPFVTVKVVKDDQGGVS
ncbi:MAG: hypothetical protein SGARI_007056, partial [Bacillariaceae sp.]